jgi:hypothetical protein
VSGWQDALEAQSELFHYWRSDSGRAFARGFKADTERKHPGEHEFLLGTHPLADAEASKMLFADPIYVSGEMMTMAEAAVEMFKPEPLYETDLLTNHGFVLLPRPFLTLDIHGKVTAWRAFSWMPAQARNAETQEVTERMGIHLSTYTWKGDLHLDDYGQKWLEDEAGMVIDDWSLLHVTPWWFDVACPNDEVIVDGKTISTGDSWWKHTQVLFRLMMQHVAIREKRQPPRATRRRLERQAPDFKDRYIVVVKLRRPKSKAEGESREVEWQHRWLVGGHWRNQWFPSLNRHRQIWINPYVKGPEDKPLVVRKARAFELVR